MQNTKKGINQASNGYVDIRHIQTDSLRSGVLDHIQSSQLQADVPNSELVDNSYSDGETYTKLWPKLDCEMNSKLKEMEERDKLLKSNEPNKKITLESFDEFEKRVNNHMRNGIRYNNFIT